MPHSAAICSSNPGPGLKDSPFPGALLVASSEFFPDSPGLSLSSRRIAPIYRVVVGTLRHAGGGFGGVMGYNLLHILICFYLSSDKGGSEKQSFWRQLTFQGLLLRVHVFEEGTVLHEWVAVLLWIHVYE